MITPAPTTKIDPKLCRGVFEGTAPAAHSVGEPAAEHIVISIPDTSYQLHLIPTAPVTKEKGDRIIGTIRLSARRIDVVQTGGRYVEPVFGRPRRVQGTVIALETDAIVVNAGVPIWVAPTDQRQSPGSFEVGQFVSFDALEGATFSPQV
ncbi:MAG: hypothetical protein KF691_12190 [Phycisphaeraceae bacterium]|nr:hypothetical protein [Phycisphaeraceae bacterium]